MNSLLKSGLGVVRNVNKRLVCDEYRRLVQECFLLLQFPSALAKACADDIAGFLAM